MRSGIQALCTLLCLCVYNFTAAQEVHTVEHPLGNSAIDIDKMVWQYNYPSDTATVVSASFVITNRSGLPVQRIRISLIAQDKNGMLLQHKTATIRQVTRDVSIEPGGQQTIHVEHAFRSRNIARLVIREITAERSNGSLEILSSNK